MVELWAVRARGTHRRPDPASGRGGGRCGSVWRRMVERQLLLPVDRHVARGFDPEADLAAIDVHHRDADIVADVDLFPELAAENQHFASLLLATYGRGRGVPAKTYA